MTEVKNCPCCKREPILYELLFDNAYLLALPVRTVGLQQVSMTIVITPLKYRIGE